MIPLRGPDPNMGECIGIKEGNTGLSPSLTVIPVYS